jgi:hypothetical protein
LSCTRSEQYLDVKRNKINYNRCEVRSAKLQPEKLTCDTINTYDQYPGTAMRDVKRHKELEVAFSVNKRQQG